MTSQQAAEALGLTDNAIRMAIKSGAIPAVRRPLTRRPNAWGYWVCARDVDRHRQLLALRPHRIGRPKAAEVGDEVAH